MDFLDAFKQETNETKTFNGANAYKTTQSGLLDFFAMAGSVRNRDFKEVINLFEHALDEDELLAMKSLFYIRDIRCGQGERDTFRRILRFLANNRPDLVLPNIELIPEYGRWDDLYSLFDTLLQTDAIELMKKQLEQDYENMQKGESVSLLAKWMKSINTSSKESRRLAQKTIKEMGIKSKKHYRKLLTQLREYLDVLEQKMSKNKFEDIDYESVPSQAMNKYHSAFNRNDTDRFQQYINDLKKGKAKINASTLTPDQIVEKIMYQYTEQKDEIYKNLWYNLPDYLEGKETNSIVVADVSGSMEGKPMSVSVGLALYFAERNNGPFKDHFITFSNQPEIIKIVGNSLYEKVSFISRSKWYYNTDVEAVFDKILSSAVKNGLKQEDIPKNIYIISDMEFDEANNNPNKEDKLFEGIEKRYKEQGYDLPKLIFWNVNSMQNNVPKVEGNVMLVSGYNPSILKYILKDEEIDARQLMLNVLNSERYQSIKI
jgi:hypothetical protein